MNLQVAGSTPADHLLVLLFFPSVQGSRLARFSISKLVHSRGCSLPGHHSPHYAKHAPVKAVKGRAARAHTSRRNRQTAHLRVRTTGDRPAKLVIWTRSDYLQDGVRRLSSGGLAGVGANERTAE